MSFSNSVKNEICRMEVTKRCCLLTEIIAITKAHISENTSFEDLEKVKISTENSAFARKVFTTYKQLSGINPVVNIRKNRRLKAHVTYLVELDLKMLIKKNVNSEIRSFNLMDKICCKKTFLRSVFLAGGSLSDPEKSYHLELHVSSLEMARSIIDFLSFFELNAKHIDRRSAYVVYIKDGEHIANFLNIIGAHNSLMDLENIRIIKDMRNNVNRVVNCETANLEKTINASIRQIDNINYICENVGLESIPGNLREIANKRIQNPEASLEELGEMMDPPLGKSGVNHRLRKIDIIANSIRARKEEKNEGENIRNQK